MRKGGKKLQVQIAKLGQIDVSHRLTIVPGAKINDYYEPRLRNRNTIDTASFSLVVLERDLSGDGQEYILMELLQSRSEQALFQAMQDGLMLADSPVLRKAESLGMLKFSARRDASKQTHSNASGAGAALLN